MWRNGEAAMLVNERADVAGSAALQSWGVGQCCPDTKQMALRSGDLNSRNNEETVYRESIVTHQVFPPQIIDRIASVMIGNSDAVQSFRPRARDQILRAGNTVAREKGVSMQVDIERHCATRLICTRGNGKRRF